MVLALMSECTQLLRPVKRPRLSNGDEAGEHTPRRLKQSGAFADMVSGLDFDFGLQKRRTLTTPKKQILSADQPAVHQDESNNTTDPLLAEQMSATKKRKTLTPMRPPMSLLGIAQLGNGTPLSKGAITPAKPANNQPQSKPMMTPMNSRIPQFRLPSAPSATNLSSKKTIPFKSFPIPTLADASANSSARSVNGPVKSIVETKDAFYHAITRERDKGKGKAREMKAMSEVKVEIDWADGELFRKTEGNADVVYDGGGGKEMRELRRGLLVSPEKGGKGSRKGKFLR